MPMVEFSPAGFHEAVEVVHVHLHLPEVLVGDLADFQIEQHIAAQQAVVENEVDEEVVFVECEALLTRLEQEAFAHFQQESFDLANNSGFEFGFGIATALLQAEKLQDKRLLEQVPRVRNGLAFLREPADALLVTAEGEAFVEARGELALELAHGPVLLVRFCFVETALVVVLDTEEDHVMGPAQGERTQGGRRQLVSH